MIFKKFYPCNLLLVHFPIVYRHFSLGFDQLFNQWNNTYLIWTAGTFDLDIYMNLHLLWFCSMKTKMNCKKQNVYTGRERLVRTRLIRGST